VYGDIDKYLQIDHINNNSLDNRIANLRLVTGAENVKNKRKYNNNQSGHTGVYKIGSKWRAVIGCDGRTIHIGMFDSIDKAISARLSKQKEMGFTGGHGL
jgi:hypothetical protein